MTSGIIGLWLGMEKNKINIKIKIYQIVRMGALNCIECFESCLSDLVLTS